MCWSYGVSVTFAAIESVIVTFLWKRSCYSRDPNVRAQWFILPLLLTILAIECIEAVLWSVPEDIVPIETALQHRCSARNQRLTFLIWLMIPFQPYLAIMACRRTGSPRNREILYVSERLALFYAIGFLFFQLLTSTNRSALRWSDFRDYRHTQTCSFLGRSGQHLQWTSGLMDTYATPNMFGYVMLSIPLLFVQPLHLIAGPVLLSETMFFFQSWELGGSFEAASVWCWSAMLILLYFCAQPYLLPWKGMHEEGMVENGGKKERV